MGGSLVTIIAAPTHEGCIRKVTLQFDIQGSPKTQNWQNIYIYSYWSFYSNQMTSLHVFVPLGWEEPLHWPPYPYLFSTHESGTNLSKDHHGLERSPPPNAPQLAYLPDHSAVASLQWNFLYLLHLPNLMWNISCVSIPCRPTSPIPRGLGCADFSSYSSIYIYAFVYICINTYS